MSKYTTGELAKRCGVTVRAIQYYDNRGILIPTELSEGGRRLYSEDDLKRLQIICFLRELGLSLNSIHQILSKNDSGSVISLLLEQQKILLKKEIKEHQEKLNKLETLSRKTKNLEKVSMESIGDIAYMMSNKIKLRKFRIIMFITSIPISIMLWVSIFLWITKGFWWLFVVWATLGILYVILIPRYYFKKVAYICPQCHTVFKPTLKNAFWAKHTPVTRKLTCPACGHHGFCVEVSGEKVTFYE